MASFKDIRELEDRFYSISIIIEEMAAFTPNVDMQYLMRVQRLAEEDDYMYSLLVEWMSNPTKTHQEKNWKIIQDYYEDFKRKFLNG